MSSAAATTSENEDACCILCGGKSAAVNLSSKGFSTLISVSHKRQDNLYKKWSLPGTSLLVHEECRKSYIATKNILTALKKQSDSHIKSSTRVLRTNDSHFEYDNYCLICGKEIDFIKCQRYPGQASTISNIEYVDVLKKSSKLQTTLLHLCSQHTDDQSVEIKARIAAAGDIRAVDAKYHRTCMQTFMSRRGKREINKRNQDPVNNSAFEALCTWLLSQQEKQFTLSDLQSRLVSYLSEDAEPYSTKHLQRRLLDHFGEKVTIAKVDGKSNILTFVGKAASILQSTYNEGEVDNSDAVKDASVLGKNIRKKLENLKATDSFYPSPDDTDIDALEKEIPDTLLAFVQGLMKRPTSVKATEKQRLVIVSLCHALMQASVPNPYLSALMLSTGLYIHQTTRSKVLLNVLSSLGFSVSYEQVMEFEKSAVLSESVEDLPPGIETQDNGGGFCQWVADNFDYNEDTLTGHNTTHVMGIIACQTPASRNKITVEKKVKSAADIASSGDFGNMLQPYMKPSKDLMSDVVLKKLGSTPVPFLEEYRKLDTLWMVSNARFQVSPSWQGFMSQITKGKYHCSSIVYHPMIPLNPQTNEAVHSTLVFIDKQRQKAGLCCAMITFDQALYAKAYKIKADNPVEFGHVQLRLGGFHQLMSFLGSGCKSMEDCGLEQVWATVYARNSIPKMFEGKAYTKTLRACLLTSAALHILLLEPKKEPAVDDAECDDDVDDGEDEVQINEKRERSNFDDETQEKRQGTVGSADDDCFAELELLNKQLMCGEQTLVDIRNNTLLSDTLRQLQCLKKELTENKTAKLWLNFMDFVSIVCMFIRAERTGNWKLHMKASQDMLPWFAATGHNNYAKYCRLYIQDWISPCPCFLHPLEDGLFTIRRKNNLFWSGTWTDMTIEQSLMRAGKTRGGLINITHKDSARTRWLLSAHVIAQYTDALREMTNTSSGSWMDHHREMNAGRISQDFKDMESILRYLRSHSPFHGGDRSQLRNIATGLIADGRVNVDNVVQIGNSVQESMTHKKFGQISLKKTDQVITFAVMKKAVKLGDGEQIRMSSVEMYQRLLSIAYLAGPPPASVFSYELAAVAPALFHEDGTMRKSQKSTLASHIRNLDPKIVVSEDVPSGVTVVDGCAVLQQLKWPKIRTLHDVCLAYISTIVHRSSVGQPILVVFDSYEVQTTKELEQKRRRLMKCTEADVVVEAQTPVPSDQSCFLGNQRNKQNTINLLSGYLTKAGISVKHAGSEGDADVVIVKESVKLADSYNPVHVVSDDTDVLILLMYHVSPRSDVYMKTRNHTISIKRAKQAFGNENCHLLPFVHAFSGCDTTSSLFGYGKIKHVKHLLSSPDVQNAVKIFGEQDISLEDLKRAGERYCAGLYTGGRLAKSLDELRYLNVVSTKYVPVERMPPTSRACYFHSLRVHLQVHTWRHLKTSLDKEMYGFKTSDGNLVPVITDKEAAPPNLLKEIRCSCKSSARLCISCSCSRMNLPCSIYCKCESACENGMLTNTVNNA